MSRPPHSESPAPAPYDVVVIGGGPSGLAAAIAAARSGASVCVLERDVAAGMPILATGNGRCNISNAHLDPARYRHPSAARAVMGEDPEHAVEAFLGSSGIVLAEEAEGRLYPVTRRAESVRDALLGACARAGVAIRCGTEPAGARFDGSWALEVREPASPLARTRATDSKTAVRSARKALAAARRRTATIRAARVVIACGGDSERICRLFGVPHLAEEPVLCPVGASIAGAPDAIGALDGLRAEGSLAIERGGERVWREEGELLFRSYGISGIAAFNLSRRIEPGDAVLIDLFPRYDRQAFHALLDARVKMLGGFSARRPSWFDGLLSPALARLVCRLYLDRHPGEHDVSPIVGICKHLELDPSGPTETARAQVRRGGIPLDAVDLRALSVRDALGDGLYACGEALDMDADCGGYNLAWAWLSGVRAGKEAARA